MAILTVEEALKARRHAQAHYLMAQRRLKQARKQLMEADMDYQDAKARLERHKHTS